MTDNQIREIMVEDNKWEIFDMHYKLKKKMNTIKVIIEPKITWCVTTMVLEWENKIKEFSSIHCSRTKQGRVMSYIKKICPNFYTPGTYEVSVHPIFTRIVFGDLPRGRKIPSNNRRIDLSSGKFSLTKEDAEIFSPIMGNSGSIEWKWGIDDVYATRCLKELVVATTFFSREKIGVAIYREYVINRGDWQRPYQGAVVKNGKVGRWESFDYFGKVISVSYDSKRDEVTVITDCSTPSETRLYTTKLHEQTE